MSDTNGQKKGAGRILVVSRNAADVRFITKHLQPEGFEILTTENCDEAHEAVVRDEIDMLMIDIAGERKEVQSFCNLLHGKTVTASIPIIAITGPEDSRQNGHATLETGADDFLGRPLRMPALLVRIRMLLRLKELHEGISRRNAELETLNRELDGRNRELEQGMEMARRLQKTLLPQKYPKVKNVSFHHIYTPTDVIGGDIFQIAPVSDDRAVVFLSDVSGHGIRAALVTSILKTVFDHVYLEDKNTVQILSDINSRFINIMGSISPAIYATAFVMMIDGNNRTAAMASAGHVCPLLVSKHRIRCESAMSPDAVGPALGFFPGPRYIEQERRLCPGDILLGFTDGIFEVLDDRQEMYGLERLKNLIANNLHLVPRDLIETVLRDTDAFRRHRKRPDDVCMVAAEIH